MTDGWMDGWTGRMTRVTKIQKYLLTILYTWNRYPPFFFLLKGVTTTTTPHHTTPHSLPGPSLFFQDGGEHEGGDGVDDVSFWAAKSRRVGFFLSGRCVEMG